MSESIPEKLDLEVLDVDLPDDDIPSHDYTDIGPVDGDADTGGLTRENYEAALQLADESEVEYGPDGGIRFRDGVDPLEVFNRAGHAPAPAGTPEGEGDDSFDRWYQRQVASYGLPRGSIGGGSAKRKRRNPLGARVTGPQGQGRGLTARLGALATFNFKFGGGSKTTNVTGLSIGGARPGSGARIASRSRKAR